jgi:hypothetical protein
MKPLSAGILASVSALLLNCCGYAHAAMVKGEIVENLPVLFVVGEIQPGDDDRFIDLAKNFNRAIVSLHSEGGSVIPAMVIGETIRRKKFGTLVPSRSTCASACALIWLAGIKRFYGPEAHIGFHGVFNAETFDASAPGNALVGAYLSKLGLSYKAILYMTKAPPDEMNWLSSKVAKQLGISADMLSDSPPQQPAPRVAQPAPRATQPTARAAQALRTPFVCDGTVFLPDRTFQARWNIQVDADTASMTGLPIGPYSITKSSSETFLLAREPYCVSACNFDPLMGGIGVQN